jgi:hypothetical protein
MKAPRIMSPNPHEIKARVKSVIGLQRPHTSKLVWATYRPIS